MTQTFNPTFFLISFKKWMSFSVVVFGLIQIIFFPSNENIFAVFIAVLAWFLSNSYLIRRNNLIKYTFSTFLILGYVLSQFSFPLILTLLEGNPITYNLLVPYQVFTHSFLAFITLIVAHLLYKTWHIYSGKSLKKKIQIKLFENHFFDSPTNLQFWIIGFIGIFANLFSKYSNSNSNLGVSDGDIVGKLIQGFDIFSYAPFFIPFSSLLRKSNKKVEVTKPLYLVLYSVLLLLIGIIANSRGLFMQAFTALGLAFFLGLLIGQIDYKIFKLKYIIFGTLGLWVITGPLSDLSTAMVVVRAQRKDISSTKLIAETIFVFQDKAQLIESKKLALLEINDAWDENYFKNIFFSRFCNLKYNDNCLKLSNKIEENDQRMFVYSLDRFWAILPLPFLDILNIEVNKNKVNSASFGDYLYMCSGGENALGGFRTGHFAGTGIASFGWYYLPLLGFGIIPLFFLIDLYTFNFRLNDSLNVVFSLGGLIYITFIFTFLGTSSSSESIVSVYSFLLRGFIQSILLYLLVIKTTNFLTTYKRL